MEDLITERIKILVDTLADKPAAFATTTGLTPQNVYDLTSGRKGAPSFASFKKILIAYPDVNERWLLLGEGDMLKTPTPQPLPPVSALVPHTPPHVAMQAGGTTVDDSDVDDGGIPQYHAPKPAKKAPVGLDLIQLVQQHSEQLQELRDRMARFEKTQHSQPATK